MNVSQEVELSQAEKSGSIVFGAREWSLVLIAAASVFLVAWLTPSVSAPVGRWYSLAPPVVAIVLAFLTRRLYTSLLLAIGLGGVLAAWLGVGFRWSGFFWGIGLAARSLTASIWDFSTGKINVDSLLTLAYVVFIMSAISVMARCGALQALADLLQRFARSRRSTQFATFLAGLIVFIDDYANTMIVGSTFQPVADRHGVSRAKLAFLVDATAAPVSGLAILSTWIGYEVGLLGELARSLGISKNGYGIFLDAVVFRFYCLGMLMFILLLTFSGLDFGPMAKAEREAVKGQPLLQRSTEAASASVRASVWAAVGPLILLVAFFVGGMWVNGHGYAKMSAGWLSLLSVRYWQDVLGEADCIRLLAEASGLCLLSVILLSWYFSELCWREIGTAVLQGIQTSLLPVTVLLLAWGLKETCLLLHTRDYLAELVGTTLWPPLFPALVFLIACICSFSTGTSWGTMAIMLPTAVPVAFHLDGGTYGLITVVTVASVLDGAIFGDHCSPISDTTIMSAAASGCDQMLHVQTQLPYAVLVATVVLLVGYLPSGLGQPLWVSLGLIAAVLASIFCLIGWQQRRKTKDGSTCQAGE